MAEEKTVTTTAVETGEKPEAAEGTTQEKPEAVAKTYDQAYVDDLIERHADILHGYKGAGKGIASSLYGGVI